MIFLGVVEGDAKRVCGGVVEGDEKRVCRGVVEGDEKRVRRYILEKHVRSHGFSTYADLCRFPQTRAFGAQTVLQRQS